MGIQQSKKWRRKEKHSFNKEMKNGTSKGAAGIRQTGFSFSNTVNTSPVLTCNGIVNLAFDAHQNREKPKTKEKEKSTENPMQLQHAPPSRPASVEILEGQFQTLHLQDEIENVFLKPSSPLIEARPKLKPLRYRRKTTSPEQQPENIEVTQANSHQEEPEQKPEAQGHTEANNASPCELWSFGFNEQPGRPTSKIQVVHRKCREMLRGVIKKNILRREARARAKRSKAMERERLWAKSERSRTNTAKHRLREKLAKKLKARPHQTAKDTVTDGQRNSQKQDCIDKEDELIKKLCVPYYTPESDQDETGGNVNVKIRPEEGPVMETEDISPAGSQNPVLEAYFPPDPAVRRKEKSPPKELPRTKPKKYTRTFPTKEEIDEMNGQVEKVEQEPDDITPALSPEYDWLPNRYDESHKFSSEPAWITTARLAACLALRQTQGRREFLH